MIKKITFSALFALLCLTSFGQLPMNTIEVKINKTVDVPVKEYVYHVSNSKMGPAGLFDLDFGDLDEYDDEDEEPVFSMPKTISWMKEQLEGAKFTCTVIPNALYDVNASDDLEDAEKIDREVIEVRVKTLEDLNRLAKFVLQLEDAHGKLNDIEFEDISSMHSTLFPEMMKMAKEKASIIGNAANKKVGDLLQVTEGSDGLSLYGDELGSYMDTMMKLSTELWKKETPTHKQVRVVVKYVFELK